MKDTNPYMFQCDAETEQIRDLNRRLDAAEFQEEHGESPEERRDRLSELRFEMQQEQRSEGTL